MKIGLIKKLIFEVLDLQDEEKNNIDKLDYKEKILDSLYISKEQLSLLSLKAVNLLNKSIIVHKFIK